VPYGEDLTDFYQQGSDLRGWVRVELGHLGWRGPDPTPPDDTPWRRWLVELPGEARTAWRRHVYDKLADFG
jgi:hypothetical protein